MKYELTGTIILIADTQEFNSGFRKREFVVETDDSKYPQKIKLEVVKDRCDNLDNYKEGERVEVHFDLRGSEYNGRYYVNLVAFNILKLNHEPSRAKSAPVRTAADSEEEIPF